MEKNESAAYWGLLALSLAFSALAVVTLLPSGAASKPNVLGYRSVCSFAPAASALCGVLAGVTCTMRNRLFSRQASATRYRPMIVPGGVGLILVVIAAVFGIRFGAAQSRFTAIVEKTAPRAAALTLADGMRSGSYEEDDVSATVEVTVAGGQITLLHLVSGTNVDAALAETLFARVKEAGSTQVDVVSGATASSNVLLRAIETAAGR
jgi:uncharacterized protein with FMN-binding domain